MKTSLLSRGISGSGMKTETISRLKVWRAPKETGFDFTTNAAFLLAQQLKIPPLEAAKILVDYINDAMADKQV